MTQSEKLAKWKLVILMFIFCSAKCINCIVPLVLGETYFKGILESTIEINLKKNSNKVKYPNDGK